MRAEYAASLAFVAIALLAGCGQSRESGEAPPGTGRALQEAAAPDVGGPPRQGTGPTLKPGGGFVAEKSGVEGTLAIDIRWQATVVTGIPAEGQITTVYDRTTQLLCPVTSSGEQSFSYFNVIDNPNSSDPFAATGSYQQWLNEECTGTLKVDDTYHFNDPTTAGEEPIVRTTGTRPFSTGDTPFTVETDLGRGRTRYLFLAPSASGFQQEEAPGYPAKLVPASAAPTATMDFTLEGPIGGGRRELAVQGGVLHVDWTFARGPHRR